MNESRCSQRALPTCECVYNLSTEDSKETARCGYSGLNYPLPHTMLPHFHRYYRRQDLFSTKEQISVLQETNTINRSSRTYSADGHNIHHINTSGKYKDSPYGCRVTQVHVVSSIFLEAIRSPFHGFLVAEARSSISSQ